MAAVVSSSISLSFSTLSLSGETTSTAASARPRNVGLASSSFRGLQLSASPAVTVRHSAREMSFVCNAAYSAADDEEEEETEEDVRAAYEALYGKPFGVNTNARGFVMADEEEEEQGGGRKRRGPSQNAESGDGGGRGGKRGGFQSSDGMSERVLQVRRVTKVVKGGKQLAFRSVVVVGDRAGHVGVGVGKAKEVSTSVQKAVKDARRHMVTVPMTKYRTFPHRSDGNFGAASVMLRPAATGTGVIAGGAVRVVLELAGLENALGKELGSGNPLNNARAVLDAVSKMKQFQEVSRERNIPMEILWK